ncbi:MAG: 50S ribosomal protein L4 [Planctomycetota bacterium]
MAELKRLQNPSAEPASMHVDEASLGTGAAGGLAKVKKRLLREAVLMYAANQRQGTHSTKTRAEVKHSERKPWKQKGTGRARAGDFASPLWRKGGIVFGPKPRDYSYQLPRKAKREALRSALLGKLRDGEVHVLESLGTDQPATKQAALALKKLALTSGALVVTAAGDVLAFRSFRNIAGVTVLPAAEVNAYEILRHPAVVFVGDALNQLTTQRLAARNQ